MKRKKPGNVAASGTLASLAFLVVLVDQVTKYLVSVNLYLGQTIPLVQNVFHITSIQNQGAAFGILKGAPWLLLLVSFFVIGYIFYYLKDILKEKKIHVPVALILGGALGNSVDRLFLGYVIDFLDFRVWPVFNVADSAITVGALWLIFYYWKK